MRSRRQTAWPAALMAGWCTFTAPPSVASLKAAPAGRACRLLEGAGFAARSACNSVGAQGSMRVAITGFRGWSGRARGRAGGGGASGDANAAKNVTDGTTSPVASAPEVRRYWWARHGECESKKPKSGGASCRTCNFEDIAKGASSGLGVETQTHQRYAEPCKWHHCDVRAANQAPRPSTRSDRGLPRRG